MIKSKKMNIIVSIALIFALTISILMVVVGTLQGSEGSRKTQAEYETELFGDEIISLEIIADEKDWQDMLDNAIDEKYIMVDVIVNGSKFEKVAIRPKGNSSLTQVVNSDSDRYSFRLEFGKYIKGQTCFGLESFVVNNMMTDNTYMKEIVSYELMSEIGVEAPQVAYTDISVNGEDWGLYLAVELYNDSYEERVYGDTSGMLYNVKNVNEAGQGGQNQGGGPPDNEGRLMPEMEGPGDENRPMPGMDEVNDRNSANRAGGKGGNNNSGGSLEYTDDKTASYAAIFENVVGKSTDKDSKRVIKALEALSLGEDLETYYDVDQILRYLAAHTIVVNLDSYSSSMAQNYYIYEKSGKITILPWDYNQAWGGFQSNTASAVVNFPIDTPVSGVELSSRPLIEKLFSNTEYLDQYHKYLDELLESYFLNGKFEARINALDLLIQDYVKNDATAFSSYEEYNTAVSEFITLGNLRAESVQGQLNGTVPSTTQGQLENPENLIQAESLNLSSLTSSTGGMGGRKEGGQLVDFSSEGVSEVEPRRPREREQGMPAENNETKFLKNNQPPGFQEEGGVNKDNLKMFGGVSLVLVLGLLFAWKFRKKY